jgi:hypothetical protein
VAKKQTEKQQKLIDTIVQNFELCEEFYSRDYKRNREDTEFVLGQQWEEKQKKERKKFKQPCLTVNKLLPFALKTVNEIRKSRPEIKVLPVDDKGDIDTAAVISGIIRNVQYVSDANTDYDTSALNSIISARGFIKVRTDYSSYDSFDQEILIDSVEDPFKAYLDPASTDLDGRDAEYFIEYENMSKDEFKRTFPDHDYETAKAEMDKWFTESAVRVVDYYYKSYESKTLYRYETDGEEQTSFDLPEGIESLDERIVQVCTVKYARTTGTQILSENEIVGPNLPVVPVYGLVMYKNGKREVYSLIHQAKDPQRAYNYWKSAGAEIVALQPKSPWVGYKGQFANNADEWARANVENIPFLEAEPVLLENGAVAPLPQRQPSPQGSATMTQEALMASDDIKAALGIYEASIGMQSNEISGVAIENRQMQGDTATYHFVDNLVTSMRQVGKIIVDMIPDVYSGNRVMRILGEDGQSRMVGVNQPVVKDGINEMPAPRDSGDYTRYDLDVGKYDVQVEVGSSYGTKRKETFALLKELMGTMPQIAEAAPDLLVKSFDVQYGDEIAERVRASMPPALLGDDVEAERLKALSTQLEEVTAKLEQTEMALQVKEDNEEFKNELQAGELEIKRQQVENDTLETQAKIKKLEAEANVAIPAEAMKDVSDAVKNLQGQMDDICETVTLVLDNEERKRSNVDLIETKKEE